MRRLDALALLLSAAALALAYGLRAISQAIDNHLADALD